MPNLKTVVETLEQFYKLRDTINKDAASLFAKHGLKHTDVGRKHIPYELLLALREVYRIERVWENFLEDVSTLKQSYKSAHARRKKQAVKQ